MANLSNNKPFIITAASAGSGKTYKLATTFISLALMQGRFGFSKILAVTFTNKATAELKERIVKNVAELASNNKLNQSGLHQSVVESIKKDNTQVTSDNYKDILKGLLYKYWMFEVSTIDSFFNKIFRNFMHERGIDGNIKAEMNTVPLFEMALDETLSEFDLKMPEYRTLIHLIDNRLDKGKSWDVRTDLIKTLTDFEVNMPAEATYTTEQLAKIEFLASEVQGKRKQFISAIKKIGQKADKMFADLNIDIDKLISKSTSPINQIRKLSDYNGGEIKLSNKVLKLFDDHQMAKDPALQADLENYLGSSLNQLAQLMANDYPLINSGQNFEINAYRLLFRNKVVDKFEQYTLAENYLPFSRITKIITEIVGLVDVPFIYEKTGLNFKHFLIDEFQDTNTLQWQNFVPLIDGAIADGNDCHIVGDVKQAIYRWRGGDADIMLRQAPKQFEQQYKNDALTTNFRSTEIIVQFNNSLFDFAPYHLASGLKQYIEDKTKQEIGTDNELITRVEQTYAETKQAVRPDHLGLNLGHIEINFFEKQETEDEDGNEVKENWKSLALAEIDNMLNTIREQGYRPADIMYLVRTNADGVRLAEYLSMRKSKIALTDTDLAQWYGAQSSESLLVVKNPAVRLLIATFGYLSDPTNVISSAEVLQMIWECNLADQLTGLDAHLFVADSKTNNISPILSDMLLHLRQTRNAYLKLSLYELSDRLIELFELHQNPANRPYLNIFQDHILNFEKNQIGNIDIFIESWLETDAEKLSLVLPEKVDQPQILTMHRAKGLQAPIVIIPFLDIELTPSATKSKTLWVDYQLPQSGDQIKMPITFEPKLADSQFAPYWADELSRAWLDGLNLMYVAFTRPETALFVTAQMPSKEFKKALQKSSCDKIEKLLYKFCIEYSTSDNQSSLQFDFAEGEGIASFVAGNKWEKSLIKKGNEEQISNEFNPQHFVSNWRKPIPMYRPRYDHSFFSEVEGTPSKRIIGSYVHEALAYMEKYADMSDALAKLRSDQQLTDLEFERVNEFVESAFTDPVFRSYFEGDFEVMNEIEILDGNGHTFRPDRVISNKNSTIIIDFKTGKPSSSHKTQVQHYIKLLSGLGFNNIKGYIYYLFDKEAVEVLATA